MGRIVVRKCPFTGKLFECDSQYTAHLAQVRIKLRAEREAARVAVNFKEFCAPLYTLASFQEIEDWLNGHVFQVMDYLRRTNEASWYSRILKKGSFTSADGIKIKLTSFKWGMQSTSHSAPFGKRVTGWGSSSPHILEKGWHGYISIEMSGRGYDFFNSSCLKKIGINSGSGGGNSNRQKYDCILYADDFPALATATTRQLVWEKMNTF